MIEENNGIFINLMNIIFELKYSVKLNSLDLQYFHRVG